MENWKGYFQEVMNAEKDTEEISTQTSRIGDDNTVNITI